MQLQISQLFSTIKLMIFEAWDNPRKSRKFRNDELGF